jgi:hypothetical protein
VAAVVVAAAILVVVDVDVVRPRFVDEPHCGPHGNRGEGAEQNLLQFVPNIMNLRQLNSLKSTLEFRPFMAKMDTMAKKIVTSKKIPKQTGRKCKQS